MEEVEHFSHPGHKLTPTNNNDLEQPTCNLCDKASPTQTLYTCKEPECSFHLHKQCFDLPPQIKVTFHGDHRTLELRETGRRSCRICTEPTTGFAYCCPNWLCMFEVHVACVRSAPCVTDKGCQDHIFERFPESVSVKSISYSCEGCGLDSDDMDLNPDPGFVSYVPYMCKMCRILVHEECSKLPRTVRIRQHPRHRISHTFCLGQGGTEEEELQDKAEEEERIDRRCCGVCEAKMNLDHGGYRCGDCGFVCHTKCTERFTMIDDEEYEDDEYEPDEPSFIVIRESLVGEGQGKMTVIEEMKHFSHHHNLVLLQDINQQSICECCTLPVRTSLSSLPSCHGCPVPGCDFYMHTSCATLPRQISVLNEFSATLIRPDRIHPCDICKEYNNGFAYIYSMIQEQYCIPCCRLLQLGTIEHEGHRHSPRSSGQIFLASGGGGNNWFHCAACAEVQSTNNKFFTCGSCNFSLDMKCAALPMRVEPPDVGNYDAHDLVLACRPLPPDSYPSHCLVCKEERNPARWFYYCSLCRSSVHVECVIGKYPRLKLGGSHKFEHPHPLTLVQFEEAEDPSSCHNCEGNDFDVGFRCTASECEYVMCLNCSMDEE